MTFTAGLAAGYVLGSRAGRETYEQIVARVRPAQSHPAVEQAHEQEPNDVVNTGANAVTTLHPVPTDDPSTPPATAAVPKRPRRTTPTTPG
jgi:hypothetical protein